MIGTNQSPITHGTHGAHHQKASVTHHKQSLNQSISGSILHKTKKEFEMGIQELQMSHKIDPRTNIYLARQCIEVFEVEEQNKI